MADPVVIVEDASPQVVVSEDGTTVIASDEATTVVEVSRQGPIGPAGPGVPAGGSLNEALLKASGADYDTAWVTLTALLVGADPAGTAAAAVGAHEADTTAIHGIADTSILVEEGNAVADDITGTLLSALKVRGFTYSDGASVGLGRSSMVWGSALVNEFDEPRFVNLDGLSDSSNASWDYVDDTGGHAGTTATLTTGEAGVPVGDSYSTVVMVWDAPAGNNQTGFTHDFAIAAGLHRVVLFHRASTGAPNPTQGYEWRIVDSSGTTDVALTPNGAGTWVRVEFDYTPPGAETISMGPVGNPANAGGSPINVDFSAVSVVAVDDASELVPYVDGDLGYLHTWDGVSGESVSRKAAGGAFLDVPA